MEAGDTTDFSEKIVEISQSEASPKELHASCKKFHGR
jgi:hypothetical protein